MRWSRRPSALTTVGSVQSIGHRHGSKYRVVHSLIRPQLKLLPAIELDHELALALSLRLTQTNVTVVEGDATSMPFKSERFTGAMAFTMFHHVTTVDLQDRMLAEILRVLRLVGRCNSISARAPHCTTRIPVGLPQTVQRFPRCPLGTHHAS